MRKLAGAFLILFLSGATSGGTFTSYNDFGGTELGWDGGNMTAYGADSTGLLIDYGTGEYTGVTMSVSVAVDPPGGALTEGTPAYDYFNGKVNVLGYMHNTSTRPVTILFTGLNPDLTYHVVLFGDAGETDWTNSNVYTIRGTATAWSFTNLSSGTISGTNQEIATMIAGYNSLTGYVADYTDIVPAADGAFSIVLAATGGNGWSILNALMLSTVEGHAPEPSSLALMGIGALMVFRRRRAG